MILLKHARIFSPNDLGNIDLLVGGSQILALGKDLKPPSGLTCDVVNCAGLMLAPGLIDGHVHIAGAGGEGGPATRTPEVSFNQLVRGGITSAVGCLGTDGFARSLEGMLMKAKGLRQQGLSCWMYSGSYQVPTPTIFGDLAKDLCFVEEIIGAGEVAIADHRSSNPTTHELIRLAKHGRVGGMLSGKAGIIHLHMGDSLNPFAPIVDAVAKSELTFKQFYPTHINRNRHILEETKHYGKHGPIDITTSSYPYFPDEEVKPSKAVAELLAAGVPPAHITLSSDAGGSLPVFDEAGNLVSLCMGEPSATLNEVADMVRDEKLPIELALATVTENPARILKLSGKGRIEAGLNADIVALNNEFQPVHLIANGCWLMRDGEPAPTIGFGK